MAEYKQDEMIEDFRWEENVGRGQIADGYEVESL